MDLNLIQIIRKKRKCVLMTKVERKYLLFLLKNQKAPFVFVEIIQKQECFFAFLNIKSEEILLRAFLAKSKNIFLINNKIAIKYRKKQIIELK